MAVSAADLVLLCTHEVLEAAGKLKDDVSAARGDPSATSALTPASRRDPPAECRSLGSVAPEVRAGRMCLVLFYMYM